MKLNRILLAVSRVAVVCLALLSGSGCSTFNRDWQEAAARPVPAGSLEGRWEGRWLSDVNGHTGKLRCIVARETGSQYEFHYWATFWKLFRATYKVHLHVRPVDIGYELRGEENLGKLAGGVYQYEGRVSGTNFTSTYRSPYDHGTFRLTRP